MTSATQTAPTPVAWTPNFIEKHHNSSVERAAKLGCCFVQKLEVTGENSTLAKIAKIVAFALVTVAFAVYDLASKICGCFTNNPASTENKEGQTPAPAGAPAAAASAEGRPAPEGAAPKPSSPPSPGAEADPKIATDAALQVVSDKLDQIHTGLELLLERIGDLASVRAVSGAPQMSPQDLIKMELMKALVPKLVKAGLDGQLPDDAPAELQNLFKGLQGMRMPASSAEQSQFPENTDDTWGDFGGQSVESSSSTFPACGFTGSRPPESTEGNSFLPNEEQVEAAPPSMAGPRFVYESASAPPSCSSSSSSAASRPFLDSESWTPMVFVGEDDVWAPDDKEVHQQLGEMHEGLRKLGESFEGSKPERAPHFVSFGSSTSFSCAPPAPSSATEGAHVRRTPSRIAPAPTARSGDEGSEDDGVEGKKPQQHSDGERPAPHRAGAPSSSSRNEGKGDGSDEEFTPAPSRRHQQASHEPRGGGHAWSRKGRRRK